MRRLVQIVGIFLGAVIVGISLLRAVQLENMLPLNSDDVGYINFQHTHLSDAQIDEGLVAVGDRAGLEIFQLSGTVGTREINIISRGANQPRETLQIAWFRPYKHGSVSSAATNLSVSRSGIYAVKGSESQRAQLEKWLAEIGAINTWERFTTFQTYFLPLAYQGVILVLAVAVFLVVATIFSWFVSRAPSRIVRLTSGHSRTRIVYDDSVTLVTIFAVPAVLTMLVLLIIFGILKGQLVWQLLIPAFTLFVLSAALLIFAVTLVSFLTFPRISDWALRRPLVAGFSGVGAVMCALAMVFALSVVSIAYRSLLIAEENTKAAEQASQIPEYHSVSFGGIVDESRDYDPFVEPFANLVSKMDRSRAVALFRQLDVDAGEGAALYEAGYRSLVVLNPKAFADLQKIRGGCQFIEQSKDGRDNLLTDEVVHFAILSSEVKEKLAYYICAGETQTVAVQHQGIFSLSTKPLIVVVPSINEALDADTITGWSTNGAIVFSDPEAVTAPATEFGLNLTTDSTADTISVYAEDQYLGYLVSLVSLVTLLLAMVLTVITSASIYAASKIHKTFPLYLSGNSVENLVRKRVILDFIFIALGVGAAALLAYSFGILGTGLLIGLASIGMGIAIAVVLIRQAVMRRSLVHICQRRS